MGLSSTTNRVSFVGDGSSTVFSFPYYFFTNSDLNVFLYDVASSLITAQTLNTNYTIAGTPNAQGVYSSGGNVVMNSAFPSALQLIITRAPSPVQNFVLNQNAQISSAAVVQQLDYLTALVQRLQDEVGRAVQIPDGMGTINSNLFNPILPSSTPLALKGGAPLILNSGATGWDYGMVSIQGGSGVVSYIGILPISNGGTGQGLGLNPLGVVYAASGSSMVSTQAGANDFPLIANSTGVAPSFRAFNLSNSSATTGVLPTTSGGTGLSAFAPQYGVMYACSATSMSIVPSATAGWPLLAQGSSAPIFAPQPIGSSFVTGQLGTQSGGLGNSSFLQWQLLYASSATSISGIPYGAAGFFLQSNGSSAPTFQAVSVVAGNITSVSTDYVTTNANNKVIATSSLFNVFLYKPVAGDAGKEIEVIKTTNLLDFNRVVIQGSNCTISRNIGVVNSTAIHTLAERVKFFTDGTNWIESERHAKLSEINLGSSTITSSGGGVVKGSSLIADNFWLARDGGLAHFRYEFRSSLVASGGANGTGDYQIQLPNGLQMDAAKIIVNSGVFGAGNVNGAFSNLGMGIQVLGGTPGLTGAYPLSATQFKIFQPGTGVWSAGFGAIPTANQGVNITGKFPVPEWNA